VGLSSVLLIAFFHERPSPPRNGLRVWVVYRFCDVALLLAAILMHEINGAGDFNHLVGPSASPKHAPLLIGPHFTLLGLLFIIAAAGKSALVPFSGWLPRAMEGPTPSSAVFYGALSVHLGVFLLLRVSPVLDSSIWLSVVVVLLGLGTSAYASLTQVGFIIAEIGFGFRYLALVHLLGHACLRTLQFLRAPSLLHDHHQLENAIGVRPQAEGVMWEERLSPAMQRRLYRFGMERGYLDSLLDKCVARPFIASFRALDALETRWARLLDGGPPAAARTETKAASRPPS
jgi:NAD(P)H-quinone oxidoreductase subunit 5